MQHLTTGELAQQVGGALRGPADVRISGIAALDEAGADQITFIADRAHAQRWGASLAAAAVVTRGIDLADHEAQRPAGARAIIEVDDAEIASIAILQRFAPPPVLPEQGVHPTAFVHAESTLGRDVRIGPHVSIERGAAIGDRVVLHAGVRIYEQATMGEETIIHANTVIRERCVIGRRVILHQSVSIGADGFGYRPSPDDGRGLLKMPHISHVVIEDDVEIGAGSCVDRGKFSPTVIGAGTKIDNLVQIAHNCRIGRGCIIAGQSGLAGSVTLGDGVVIGAQVGIADGIRIGDGVKIAARAGLMRDVAAGQAVAGEPAQPAREALRREAALRRLPELIQRLSRRPPCDESPGNVR